MTFEEYEQNVTSIVASGNVNATIAVTDSIKNMALNYIDMLARIYAMHPDEPVQNAAQTQLEVLGLYIDEVLRND